MFTFYFKILNVFYTNFTSYLNIFITIVLNGLLAFDKSSVKWLYINFSIYKKCIKNVITTSVSLSLLRIAIYFSQTLM